MSMHNNAFAWSDEECSCFKAKYFSPVEFPVVPHMPWVEKNIPILPRLYKEICKILKCKIAAGIYKPSNSVYRT